MVGGFPRNAPGRLGYEKKGTGFLQHLPEGHHGRLSCLAAEDMPSGYLSVGMLLLGKDALFYPRIDFLRMP